MSDPFFIRSNGRRGTERTFDPKSYHFVPEMVYLDMPIPFHVARGLIKLADLYGKHVHVLVDELLSEATKDVKT